MSWMESGGINLGTVLAFILGFIFGALGSFVAVLLYVDYMDYRRKKK